VDAGSREENASKHESGTSVLIQSEPKLQVFSSKSTTQFASRCNRLDADSAIFQLTSPARAEMVPRLQASLAQQAAVPDAQPRQQKRELGGNVVAIARKNEPGFRALVARWLCAPTARRRSNVR
jgi:hypothetical protein